MSQLNSRPAADLRSKDRVYHIDFEGEGSADAGGPYRESLSQMCWEIERPHMPLLIPCANRKADLGENREKFLPNPSLTSPFQMSFFNFLGKLIGISLRTHATLPLNLPSIVWKRLVRQRATINDLRAIDATCVKFLDQLRDIESEGVTADIFEDVMEQYFVTQSSDGREVPVKPGGSSIRVTFENRFEYCQLVEEYRLHEFDSQVDAIAKGVGTIVPLKMVRIQQKKEKKNLYSRLLPPFLFCLFFA